MPYRVASARPLNKVVASTLGGAITAIGVWALNTYASAQIPVEVASAATVLVSTLLAYLVPLAPGEVAPAEE
jgi:hypothetical protein